MAERKAKPDSVDVVQPEEQRGTVEGAADGSTSNRTAGYKDNPDAPPSSVAQIEELKDVGE